MAQSRRSRAHVSGRAAALARLAAARAGEAWALSSGHTTPAAGGIPLVHLCQLIWAAAAVEVSAPARLLGGTTAPPGPAAAPRGDRRQSNVRRLS
jgi:hypothetical protein